jgi:predicted Zn-dependent protease
MNLGMRNTFLILCSGLLVACTTTKKPMAVQIPNETWWQTANTNQTASSAEKNLATVRQKMVKTVPFPFVVGMSDSTEINAFAELQNNQRYIIFTNGFIAQFGNDPDVMATVMGHELAHHQLGHTQADYAKNRDAAVDATSQALGMIASYFIPFSGLIIGNAAKGVGLTFSRNDERSADEMGMQWAMQAGYSPCGSYRFAARMNALGESASIPFLSTHPGNDERMETASSFSQARGSSSCDLKP